jgi:hypothetical protein
MNINKNYIKSNAKLFTREKNFIYYKITEINYCSYFCMTNTRIVIRAYLRPIIFNLCHDNPI